MRVKEILGKDVHNMKARSLWSNPGFEGGQGGVQGCLGEVQGASREVHGGVEGRWGHSGKTEKARMRGGCRGVQGCLGGGSGGSRGGPGF